MSATKAALIALLSLATLASGLAGERPEGRAAQLQTVTQGIRK